MKRIALLIITILLISCGSSKVKTHKTEYKTLRDTITLTDTIRVVKTDSTYKHRFEQLQEQVDTRSDSIVYIRVPGKVITKTYGKKTQVKRYKRTIDRLTKINSKQKIRISKLENRT